MLAPLLGKTNSSSAPSSNGSEDKSRANQKKHETETVKALLSMSAVDTPLLMLAFAAGISTKWDSACVQCCHCSLHMSCDANHVQKPDCPIAKPVRIYNTFSIACMNA